MKDKLLNEDLTIVFIISSLRLGGAEKVFVTLLNAWNFEKTKVTLIVLNGSNTNLKIDNPDIEVVFKRYKRASFSMLFLYRYLLMNEADTVICTGSHLNLLILALSRMPFLKFKTIIRDASVSSIMERYGAKQLPKVLKIITKRLKRKLYPYASKIICQSNDISDDIINNLRLNDSSLLTIAPNPLIISPYNKLSFAPSYRRDKEITFIFVARFMPVKGHDRLIRIFKRVRRPFCLKLVGEGPQMKIIREKVKENQLEDRVDFTGIVVPPYSQLIKADVYVQTSYVEGFPNALLESLGMGLPVLAFNVPGGTREIVNSKNGILVQDGDEDAFVEAIEYFDPSQYDNEWIIKDVYERFGIQKVLNQYHNIILS